MSKKWTKADKNILKNLLEQNKTYSEISVIMDRSYKSIEHAINRYRHELDILNRRKTKKIDNYEIILKDNDVDIEQIKHETIKKWNLNWKIKKSTKSSKKKNFKTYLVTCDHHIPYHNKVALNAIFKIMDDVVFDGNIILGDFCYSSDTEILTPSGWKTFDKLTKEDEVLSYNRETGKLRYKKPVRFQEFDYEGDMINFRSNKLDLLVSPEHKVLYRQEGNEYACKAWELLDHKKEISLPVSGIFDNNLTGSSSVYNKTIVRNLKIPIAMTRLIGWIVTEGWLEKNGNYRRISTSQSVANSEKCKMIEQDIKMLGFLPYISINKKTGVKSWRFNGKDTERILSFFDNRDNIHDIPRIILDLSNKHLTELFRILMLADGYAKKNKKSSIYTYVTTERRLMEQVCELSHKLGYSTSVSKQTYKDKENKLIKVVDRFIDSHKLKDIYYIYISNHRWSTVKKVSKKKYSGKIYDVSLFGSSHEGGWLVIRRKEKIMISGNCDMTPISHWLQDKKKRKSLENLRMKKDYIIGNMILDEFDKRLPKKCDKRYFWGNHEKWWIDMIEKYPVLEGFFKPTDELKLIERGYKVYEDNNHIERIGRLAFTHGMYTTMNHVKKHIDDFKTNVIYGHLHTIRSRLESSPAKEIAISGYSVGCTCNLNPEFMKNRPNKWSHGFAIVYFYDNGFFDIDNKRIINGKVVFNGKLYDGNKK